MKNAAKRLGKNVRYKNTLGYRLAIAGAALVVLPFVLIGVLAAIGNGVGANIGIGILGFISIPLGLLLIFVGLLLLMSHSLKK